MEAIKIENFSKNYDKFKAVKNVSLVVEKGQIVGFVGKNGAGKSTTLRSMLDMINVTSGKISILGLDSKKNSKEIKSKVSYVPSETFFYDNVKVKDILNFAQSFTNSDKELVNELAKDFELPLNKKVSELSLGNRKKISLIQALIKDSELIILDEPTSGLDPLIQNKFFEYLIKEKAKGKTIFMSSHNLSEIQKYCDKVAIIKEGRIVDYIEVDKIVFELKQIVTYKTVSGEEKTFEYGDDINELVKKLSKLELQNLEIKNKTVEDEFIKYYKGNE